MNDLDKPDGALRRLLDCSRLSGMGWRAVTPLHAGLQRSYADFLNRTPVLDQ